jgi:hypothetical protein
LPEQGPRSKTTSPPQADHASHGSHAGTLFAFEEDLRQKSPQGDRRSENDLFVVAERNLFLGHRPIDGFFRDHVGERQAGML